MASRHEIVSIDFRANAGKANPAIESLKASAEAANKRITELRANIEKGGTAKQIEDWNKEITALDKKVKTLENAQRTLVKGVGTLNQAIEAFNNGSLDQMNAKFQKAAKNALELQKTQLNPNSETYKKDLAELEALGTRLTQNMQRMKLHTDDLIATIQAGGKVSASELRQEINGLTELLDLIPKGTDEYKQYDSQLQTIQTHVTTLSENERRLAGEIVTVADAMKMANASTREAAEQRMKDAAAAKQQAETERATLETQREASRLKIETAEKEAVSIKEQIAEQEKLVKSQEALYEASDRADKEVDEARKNRDAARESTKQYTDAITTAANKVADLKKQLEELNGTPVKPQVDTSELDRLKAKLESIESEIKEAEAESEKWKKGGPEGFLSDEQIKQEIIKRTQKFYAEQLGQPLRQESISVMQQMPMSELLKEGYSGKLRQFDVFSDLESMWKTHQGAIDDRIKKIDGLRQKYNDVVQEIEKLNAAQQQSTQANQAETKSVEELEKEMEALNATTAKPKVDTSEVERLRGEVESVQKEINILLQDNLFNTMSLSHKELPREWDLESNGFTQKFTEKFGLQESYANRRRYIATKGMFHGPEDTDMWDIEEFYKNDDDNGWGYTKQDWKEILDDYKWFDESLQAVVESIGKQYEKLSHAAYMGADPETLKGMANGIKKLEELKERMLSIAAKDKDYNLEYNAGQGKLFREQFGDVEGDMKKAVETVERGLKEITGMRSKAIEKRVQEDREYYEQQIKNNEKEIESKKAVREQIEAQIKSIEKLAGAGGSQPNPTLEGLKKDAELADSAIAKLEDRLKELRNPDRVKVGTPQEEIAAVIGMGGKGGNNATIFNKLQNQLSDAWVDQDETTIRAFLRNGGFTGVFDKDNLTHYKGVSKKDMITQLTDYINNRLGGYDVSDDNYGIASGGKYYDMDWLEELTEKERQKFLELSYEKQKAWVERAVKKQFGEIDAVLYQGSDDATAYVGKGDSAVMGLRSVMSAEMWKGGKSENDVNGIPKEEIEAQQMLVTNTKELIQVEDELSQTEHLLETAKKAKAEIDEKIARATEQQSNAEQQSVDADKKKAEVTKQLADAQADLDKAKKDAEEPMEKLAKAADDLREAEKKQTKAYEDLNTAREKQDFAGQNEKLGQLERQYDELTGSIEKEKQALTENATAAKEAYDKETEAAIEMAQAQNYSQKSLEDSIALLEKQSKVETDPKKYKEMTTAIETMQQRVKEMTGEWMSYAEAEKYAESIGTDGFIATSDQLQKATQSLTRYKDALIKSIQKRRESKNLTEEEKKALAEEEAELKKVEAELKKMKFEMDNANMSSKRMHEILKDPKSAKNIEELSAAIKRSTQELKLMEETIGKDNAKYKEMAEQTKKATIEQKNMEAQFKASSSAFEKAWSRLKTYVGLYVGAAVAMQKIVATMGDLMELSDKMGEVRKTTGFTADEVGRLSDNLKKLDVRTSLTSLMELSSLAGSVGLKTQQDVQGFTEAANQLLIALPEMGNESARTLIKIAQATGDLQKNGGDVRETLEKVGSTIIALRANSASAAGPITDFVSRVGAVGAQAGISIDQIAALGSTIDALGGRVEMSATALSRMIPAIRNNSYAIANSIGVTESYLKSLAPMEQMVLIFQKMRDSIKGIDTSTEEGQKQMADNVEAILGKSSTMREVMKDLEQQGARAGIVFGLLSQNVDELQKQLGIAGEAYKDNIALQEEFNKMNDTTAAKWARLKNQLEEMFVSDSAQRTLGTIIDGLRWIPFDIPIFIF